jgi:hypothetical protein
MATFQITRELLGAPTYSDQDELSIPNVVVWLGKWKSL